MLKKITLSLLKHPALGGVLLIFCCVFAMLIKNSNYSYLYDKIINYPIFGINTYYEKFTILNLVNDVLMTLFFLEIGLEIKNEMLVGSLNSKAKSILPGIAAIGGMAIPALIYSILTINDTHLIRSGWAISIATDIVFAVGILKILGNRVPKSLVTFLLALAIFDDIGAILAIALFYSNDINQYMILFSLGTVLLLFLLNIYNIRYITLYLIIGILLWISILYSGIHVTLSGIILGIILPHKFSISQKYQDSIILFTKKLSYLTKYFILPAFAFVNSGVCITNISYHVFNFSLSTGIFLGLVFGKPIGVFSFSYLSILLKISKLPEGISLKEIFGISILCGIGFTMSMFISNLAFSNISTEIISLAKFSILFSSLISGIFGFLFLYKIYKK
ncbi:MAG: Na+/H+ antiporter NhaA [Wigglesworthia glossinidia]|nr:Na+/H+ antiporter NhaA [Wigglesworthia glossinidia]